MVVAFLLLLCSPDGIAAQGIPTVADLPAAAIGDPLVAGSAALNTVPSPTVTDHQAGAAAQFASAGGPSSPSAGDPVITPAIVNGRQGTNLGYVAHLALSVRNTRGALIIGMQPSALLYNY